MAGQPGPPQPAIPTSGRCPRTPRVSTMTVKQPNEDSHGQPSPSHRRPPAMNVDLARWQFADNIFGAPLAMEGLGAFFPESTFLGLWLFGWDKLPRQVHLLTIWLVAFGSAFRRCSSSGSRRPGCAVG